MERETLGALRYQSNRAVLHTDASLLPAERRAWASWNYHRLEADRDEATLTYYLNRLQGIDSTVPVLVTLNRDEAIDPDKVLARMEYAHPVLDPAAVRAKGHRGSINGTRRTWFVGAYWGDGFHEDGVRSAVETCRAMGVSCDQWATPPSQTPGPGPGQPGPPARPGPERPAQRHVRGSARHRRFGPGPDTLVQLPGGDAAARPGRGRRVMRLHPAWSARRPSPVALPTNGFHRRPATPLDRAVRDLVAERTGRRPEGPVAMLANLRTWGWLFNPISLYFCADVADLPDHPGRSLLVAEVENTPWHDRHAYVVGPPGAPASPKSMHVSPFLPLDLDYELRYTAPGERLLVRLDVLDGDGASSPPTCRFVAVRSTASDSVVSSGATRP